MPSSWNAAGGSDPLAPFAGAADVAIVLGSGLAGFCDAARIERRVSYAAIPSLFRSEVPGHPGFLALADFGGRSALVFAGRSHVYEGPPVERATAAVSLAADLGCRELLLTNAAGSFSPEIEPGSWLLPEDVLPFPARAASALGGASAAERAFAAPLVSPRLRRAIRRAAEGAGTAVADGVLAWMIGPCYETAAEARAARAAGADAATMSIYPELVAARTRGLEAAVLSWITNFTANVSRETVDHREVMRRGGEGAARLAAIVARYLGSPRGA